MIRVLAMLTKDDQTVENAFEVYQKNKNAKTPCWGFKDINISIESAKILAEQILRDEKEFFFESLVREEEEAIDITKLAIECNADYLTAMEYFDSVNDLIKDTKVKYFPTCGKRGGYPRRMLYGTIDEIINDAKRIALKGVDGICLSVFRYEDGDPIELTKRFVNEVDIPLVVSGSINNDERLDFIREVKPWGFTIGTALFDDSFGPEKSIQKKLDHIYNYVNS